MSSSWNFPARASPSCESSKLSWGTLVFEQKPSWQNFRSLSTITIKFSNFGPVSNYHQSYVDLYEFVSDYRYFSSSILYLVTKFIQFQTYSMKITNHKNKIEISARFGQFSISSWIEKRSQAEPSQAENPLARAMARASLARTHHYQ
jgi:hypothetical protein